MSVTHIIYVVCIHEWESICGLQSQLFSENERLFKVSPPPLQAVTYTVKVVVSKKWCKIDTLLLNTTSRQYHMTYQFLLFPMTFAVIRLL